MYSSTTQFRVKYSETDQMGYVYYGNYAQYYEIGRAELFRNIGISYCQLEDDGFFMPVSEMYIKYKRPAKYDNLLTIKTTIKQIKGVRIYFYYELFNEDDTLLNYAETTMYFVSKNTMKPAKPPEWFVNELSKYIEFEEDEKNKNYGL